MSKGRAPDGWTPSPPESCRKAEGRSGERGVTPRPKSIWPVGRWSEGVDTSVLSGGAGVGGGTVGGGLGGGPVGVGCREGVREGREVEASPPQVVVWG